MMGTAEVLNGNSRVARSISVRGLDPAVEIHGTGLLFSRSPSLSSWEAIGRQILSLADSSTWWIADWLAYGESAFKDRYLEAIAKTNLNYQTLRNYAWVARRFEFSRRRVTLSFGHHAEVASLESPEQDYWLRKAEESGWSRNYLRNQVRASLKERRSVGVRPIEAGRSLGNGRGGEDAGPEPAGVLRLVLSSDQIALFKSIADAQRMELHEWAVDVLESAAKPDRSGRARAGY